MLNRRCSGALCALLPLVLAFPAAGDVLDPNLNPEIHIYNSRTDNPLGPFETGMPGTFALPQFDDTLQVWVPGVGLRPRELVTVTLIVTGEVIDGYNAMENEDPMQADALVEIGARIRVSSNTPAAPLVVLVFPRDSNSGTLQPDNDPPFPDPDFLGTDMIAAIADGDQDANNDTIDVAGDAVKQAPWVGRGDVTWSFDANSYLFAEVRPAIQPISALQSPKYHFTAEVQYVWQVAPEPVTATLLGMGAAGILLRKRRRRLRPLP